MEDRPKQHLVVLTPPGRGAVATVLIEGPGAREALQAVFQSASKRPMGEYASDQPIFGRLGPSPGEEVVLHCRSAEGVEIHCHGGTAAVERLEKLFADQGFSTVNWHDWVSSQEIDPIAAAARRALADAPTARTAAILLDQYHGALQREFGEIEGGRRKAEGGPIENPPSPFLLPPSSVPQPPSAFSCPPSLFQRLETLQSLIPLGRHLTVPWRVVLAGRPNVGKSSLLNALVGYGRAIVHEEPGTTRDAVTARTAFDGWPVELCDTAGLRESACPIEQTGVQLAQENMRQADLVLLVFDASQPWTIEDQTLCDAWPDAMTIHNKCDLPTTGRRPSGLFVSALTGQGIEALAQAIAHRLVPHPPPPGAAVPFAEAHFRQIEKWTERNV